MTQLAYLGLALLLVGCSAEADDGSRGTPGTGGSAGATATGGSGGSWTAAGGTATDGGAPSGGESSTGGSGPQPIVCDPVPQWDFEGGSLDGWTAVSWRKETNADCMGASKSIAVRPEHPACGLNSMSVTGDFEQECHIFVESVLSPSVSVTSASILTATFFFEQGAPEGSYVQILTEGDWKGDGGSQWALIPESGGRITVTGSPTADPPVTTLSKLKFQVHFTDVWSTTFYVDAIDIR
jgi:hypothetical protein